jgi:hypothetical protein
MQSKTRKERLTITVDRGLLRAAQEAVAAGRADSVSGWVNRALEERAAKERRLAAMAEAVAAYEAEFGEITEDEMLRQEREDRRHARVVHGPSRPKSKSRRRGAA